MTEEHPIKSLLAAWGGWGLSKWLEFLDIHSWSDFAAMCASVVSLLLIADWVVKKWRALRRKA